MNFLKKGPELKLSAIKVPNFLLDIYYDLKERHLLPVAAVLLLAIVVVPFALTQSGPSEEPEAEGAVASGAAAVEGSGQLVAQSAPRLREYKRRLSHLTAKDPFLQQYVERETGAEVTTTEPEAATSTEATVPGTEFSSGAPESFSAEPSIPTSPSPEPAYEPPPSSTPPTSNPTTPSEPQDEPQGEDLKWFSYAVDVRVVTHGPVSESSSTEPNPGAESDPAEKPESTIRHNLPELTMLPSRKTPAITYMGSTSDGKKALMLVSSDVKAVFGDARCVIGSETCQLLAMEPELPQTFVYGTSGKTYTIELRKIDLVRSDKINRAPLGEPKQKDEAPQSAAGI
jgi:hypothetical protein